MDLEHAVALQPLDIRTTHNTEQLVDAMSQCSFGARMLGDVFALIRQSVEQYETSLHGDPLPIIICDDPIESPMHPYLKSAFRDAGYAEQVLTTSEFANLQYTENLHQKIIVVGAYNRYCESLLLGLDAVFINQFGMVPQGTYRDGYFPNMIVGDPGFIMPLLKCYLDYDESSITDVIDAIDGLRLDSRGGFVRDLRLARDTLYDMIVDPDCMVFMTASGAMTIAQMGLLLCDMIEEGMIQSLTTTGALIAHGLAENIGLKHYKHNPKHVDDDLARELINRVTDTWEPESNLDHVELILRKVLASIRGKTVLTPSVFYKYVGAYITKHFPTWRGIVSSAYKNRVPIFNPAFIDSEVGNDVFVHNERRKRGINVSGKKTGRVRPKIVMDMELDTWKRVSMKMKSKRLGIFSIGGGVPRNNDQNDAPLIEILNGRVGLSLKVPVFNYGVRIAPDQMYYGHLSGCTYSEGKSWRKMDPSGKFAEVQADATIVWPFILRSIMEKLKRV